MLEAVKNKIKNRLLVYFLNWEVNKHYRKSLSLLIKPRKFKKHIIKIGGCAKNLKKIACFLFFELGSTLIAFYKL
jgi:hypothetical protein